ncbi:UNVERIFIED_CONTAM: hypothetical protein Sradi_5282400 [Sesamum radiatum]|uniref:Transposase MuDR plant domain-containing protein n=1 Tax=Sesamum radiatum TaxID=300843 RepID=A0AAW2LM15_SESRA
MRNEKTRVTGHCSVKDCPWRIHASPLADGVTFHIKTYVPNHTCVRSYATGEASPEWIAEKIENVLRENPGMKPRGIRNELKKFGVNPQYMQIYRARKKAMESIEGSYAESFGKLPYYAKIVLANNERSVVTLQCDVDESESIPHAPVFKRFFLGLSALRDGFLEGGWWKPSMKFVPNAVNRRCARHIYANFRGQFAGAALKRVWDVSGIPCKHAALGISHRRESLESFCDSRFFKENYMKAYSYCIHPVPDPTFWPQDLEVEPTNLLPPIVRRMPHRPKKNRRKEPSEAPNVARRSNMVRCKVCNDLGHNKRTCLVSQHKGKDLELDVPLAQLASRKRKIKGSSSQSVASTKTNKKTKAKSLFQPVPKPPISSSQPLPNTEHGPSMHVAGSASQPPSNSGATYLPPSFWRGLGVSPQREIRSKNNKDAKEVNPYEACKQQ